MAAGYSGIDSTITIGNDIVVISARKYGTAWTSASVLVNGVSTLLNRPGVTDIDVHGVVLEFTIGDGSTDTFRCKFKNSVNTYTQDWAPVAGEQFFNVINTSGPGTDELPVVNTFIGKLPILREILI